jgi:hypothetical protein
VALLRPSLGGGYLLLEFTLEKVKISSKMLIRKKFFRFSGLRREFIQFRATASVNPRAPSM